jgi:hypothetical protein
LYTEPAAASQAAEHVLHSLLVPLSVGLTVQHLAPVIVEYRGPDVTASMLPHLFAILLVVAMLTLGRVERHNGKENFIVQGLAARLHMAALLMAPPLMFVASFHRRILSKSSLADVWLDLILVWCVPYLLLYLVHVLNRNNVVASPYQISVLFGSSTSSTLLGAVAPIVVSLIASLAIEYEYLIPFCRSVSYNFRGHDLPSHWLVSILLTAAIMSALFGGWVAGRKSSVSGQPLFGEYHDDVLQLSIALCGMLIGKAVGMPWSLTPLPILAVLGTVIWLSTRMLRYLAMLLFVAHSTAMVVWSYRYAGIETKIDLLYGVELTLFRFGMVNVGVSLLVLLAMGLAVRSSGGIWHSQIRRFDVCGICLLVYTILQSALECILLRYPIPFQDLSGIEVLENPEDHSFLYMPIVAYITGATLCGISLFLQHYKVISPRTAIPTLSLAAGKAIAVYIEMHIGLKGSWDVQADAFSLLVRALSATLLLFIILAPRAFLTPIHFKVSGTRHSMSDHGMPLPDGAYHTVILYGLVMLPLALIVSIPWVLRPLVGVLSGHFGAYYATLPAASETFGWTCALWGLALLSALNHLLPDGGAETWKKTSALTFLMGMGVAMAAPTVPSWMSGGKSSYLDLNPFAFFSSASPLGGRSTHAGGWGLLTAALATLLAVTGPLELQERPEKSDRSLLLRTMVFSILFGCGVAWFVTLEMMIDEAFLPLFCTATACMAMSFFGTVGGVLSYFLDIADFDEAEQVLKVWIGAFPIFMGTAALSQLAKNVAHPFGVGGWLSTYLSVCGLTSLALCIALRMRSEKNSKTRGVGNSSCVFSWACWIAVLFGRYGIAGMDADFGLTTFFGIPASVLGTAVVSLVLLLLEGESSKSNGRAHGRKRINAPSQSGTSSGSTWMYLDLAQLTESNRLAPPVFAVATVLVVSSLYAVLLRGLVNAATQQRVFDSIYNSGGGSEDLATLAKKNLLHRQAVQTATKLSSASFWTARNPFVPLQYLLGLAASLPSLVGLVLFLWSRAAAAAISIPWGATVPLNLFPLVMCQGLPPLVASAVLGLLGGTYHFLAVRGEQQRSNMRI